MNVITASLSLPVPTTRSNRRESVPPGTVVLGVDTTVVEVEPLAVAVLSDTNCTLLGSTSARSRLFTVCPGATAMLTVYVCLKFGPVAVSASGALEVFLSRKSWGSTGSVVGVPSVATLTVGLPAVSVWNWKPPVAVTG